MIIGRRKGFGLQRPSWDFGSKSNDISTFRTSYLKTFPSSLKNHGADEEVDGMFDMGADATAIPMEEKMKFEQGDTGFSFG